MDIRNFFGGGAKSKPTAKKPEIESTSKTKEKPALKPSTKQSQTPTKAQDKDKKAKDKNANKVKEEEITIVDSDSQDVVVKKDTNHNKRTHDFSDSDESGKEIRKSTKTNGNSKSKKSSTSSDKSSKKSESKTKKKKTIESDSDEEFTSPKQSSRSRSKESGVTKKKKENKTPPSVDKKKTGSEKKKTKESEKKKSKSEKYKTEYSSEEEEEEEDEEDYELPQVKTKKAKKSGKKGQTIYDSDSNDEMIPDTPKEKRKRQPRKPKAIKVYDSDDESKPNIMEAFQKMKSKKSTPEEKKPATKKPSPPKHNVSVMDFFGGGSVKRVDSKLPSSKRKASTSPVRAVPVDEAMDMEIHDDDDFEATLAALDEKDFEQKPKRQKLDEEKIAESSKSLSSKLADKVKAEVKEEAEASPLKKMKSPIKKSPEKSPAKSPPKKATEKSPIKVSPKKAPPPQSPPKKTPPKAATAVGTPGSAKVSPGSAKVTPGSAKVSPDDQDTPQTAGRKGGGEGYRAYLHRAPPQALGSKEIPEGQPNCLEGLTFVISGVLESMERDEAKSLLERYGAKVTGNISKKTDYVVFGRDAGVSKTAKAEQFGTKQLDEDGVLGLIRTRPGKKSKFEIQAEKDIAKEKAEKVKLEKKKSEEKVKSSLSEFQHKASPKAGPSSPALSKSSSQSSANTASLQKASEAPGESLLWVDKYKPQSMKQIIGQQGDKSNAKKLLHWLNNWHRNVTAGKKPTFSRFNDDGSGHKAALLSGPPGVGKTTTASIVCKEAGFTFVELNASDTRSKKSLQQVVAELLDNQTISAYMPGSSREAVKGKNHCLVMDEVDGMAGNEDRGGMAELIGLIKGTRIPIICMCNDRNHQKVRSLANHCFDLRFQRPRVDQIKAAMMSMAFKEGVKIPPPALNEIILASNQDVRQVIHNLSMWSADDKNISYDKAKANSEKAKKDIKLGPFDVCRKVFVGGEETAHMSIHDKSDLFFHDYSFGPLFVQENYINVHPYEARGDKKKHLSILSRAADSICDGDLVDRIIRREQKWGLLPTQAIYSSVIPGDTMRGGMSGMVTFPVWLGKNSSTNKTERVLGELRHHMCLNVTGDKRAINMDYLPHLRRRLTRPLVTAGQDGVPDVIKMLDDYDLLKEDFDNIIEISQWPGMSDPMSGVESKTKAAFTRTYNKESHMTPYAAVQVKKGRGRGAAAANDELGEEGEDGRAAASDAEKSDDDMGTDAMIKQSKKPAAGKGKTSAAGSSRGGKGGGRGGAKGGAKGGGGKGRGKAKK